MNRIIARLSLLAAAGLSLAIAKHYDNTVIDTVAEVTAYRTQVEDRVREIRSRGPAVPEGEQVTLRDAYNHAAVAVNSYLDALQAAMADHTRKRDATDAAVRAGKAAEEFVRLSRSVLPDDRSLLAVAIPLMHLAVAMFDMPHHKCESRAAVITRSVAWRSWEKVR